MKLLLLSLPALLLLSSCSDSYRSPKEEMARLGKKGVECEVTDSTITMCSAGAHVYQCTTSPDKHPVCILQY